MALTITVNGYTLISACDATTGWSPTPTLDTVMKIENTGCMAAQVKSTTSSVYKQTGTWNLSGKLLYVWMCCAGLTDTKANGGFRIVLNDATNTGTWYVGGGLVNGGWNCFCIDPNSPPTLWNGSANTNNYTLTETAITGIGVQFKTLTTVVGSTTNNCFWDFVYVATSFKFTSGASDNITLATIEASISSSCYGCIIEEKSGTFLAQGRFIFGDADAALSIDFEDENAVLSFPANDFVLAGGYSIVIAGNSTGTTNFSYTGGLIKSNGVAFIFDASDTDIDLCLLSGTTLLKGAAVTFTSICDILNTTLSGCGQINPGLAEITGCVINNTTDTNGAMLWVDSWNVENCSFLANGKAIQIADGDPASKTFTDLSFSGNTYDVNNTSGVSLTVNNVGSNASTYTGTSVSFVNNPVTTIVTVKSLATGSVIEGARVYLIAAAGGPLTEGTVIFNELTNSSGVVDDTRSLASDQPVTGWVRKSSGIPYYKTYVLSGTIDSDAGLNMTALLVLD